MLVTRRVESATFEAFHERPGLFAREVWKMLHLCGGQASSIFFVSCSLPSEVSMFIKSEHFDFRNSFPNTKYKSNLACSQPSRDIRQQIIFAHAGWLEHAKAGW